MEFDATPNGADSNALLTLEEADAEMEVRLQDKKWDDLENDDERKKLLVIGSRLVEEFTDRWPPKQDPNQAMIWPTSKDADGVVPVLVKRAVMDWVEMHLAGTLTGLKELQGEGVSQFSALGQSMGTTDFATVPMDRTRLPAGARRKLEQLLSSYQTIVVDPRTCDPEAHYG